MSKAIKSTLLTDNAVRVGAGLFVAVIFFFMAPFLFVKMFGTYSRLYIDLPLLALLIFFLANRLQRIENRAERRCWILWSLGLSAWLAQVVLVLVTQGESIRSVETDIASNLLFFLFYVALAMGIESQPHVSADYISSRWRKFAWLGVFTFYLGLLLYFVIVPLLFEPNSYSQYPWVFYLGFDLYLSIRLAGFVLTIGDRRWRRIYTWLLAAALCLLCSDGIGLAVVMDVIEPDNPYAIFDPFLIASLLAVLMAIRSREPFRTPAGTVAAAKPIMTLRPVGLLGSLVFYAMMFPLMHFGFAKAELLSPSLAPIRETLVLVFLVLLSILAYVLQRLVLAENRRLEDERNETTRALQQSESRFRSAFENITTGSVVIDSRGIIESINPMARKIFGYSLQEVIGNNLQMLMLEPYSIEHDGVRQHSEEARARYDRFRL
jgi:PAS domain-containing protein